MANTRTIILIAVAIVLLSGVGIALYLILGNNGPDDSAAVAKQAFAESLYRFEGLYTPKEDTGDLNVCASGQNAVECADDTCSNCVCPEVCALLGKQFMMMDNQWENSFRCKCADTLEELVEPGSKFTDFDSLGRIEESYRGDVWKKINRWKGVMLPAEDKESDAFKYGVGGVYPFGHAYWTEDALNKVVIGSSFNNLAAVYYRPLSFEDQPLLAAGGDEIVHIEEPGSVVPETV